jgi:hypothetical protein
MIVATFHVFHKGLKDVFRLIIVVADLWLYSFLSTIFFKKFLRLDNISIPSV